MWVKGGLLGAKFKFLAYIHILVFFLGGGGRGHGPPLP